MCILRGVQSSFNEVNQAQQEREQMINVANGEYNKAVPKARGEADQQLRAAEGDASAGSMKRAVTPSVSMRCWQSM